MDCVPNGCTGGWPTRAYDYIIQNGITTEAKYPYHNTQGTCQKAAKDATISSYHITNTNEAKLRAYVARQPIAVPISVGGDFRFYKSGVFNGDCGQVLTHAVGYGGGTEASHGRYWIAKNQWGENGYVRLARDVGAPTGVCNILSSPMYPVL